MLRNDDGAVLVLSDGAVAGEGCDDECCGPPPTCGWWRVVECPPQEQLCGPVPLPRTGYVWSCIECAGGPGIPARPLAVGDVFLWLDSCWTVQDDAPIDIPPQGALVRTDLTPVQCAGEGGCDSPLCPNRDTAVYYVATPCVTGQGYPNVFVCGFDGTCAVFNFTVDRSLPNGGTERRAMCYTVRRTNPVPGDQVPPTAQRFDVTGLVGFRTCCTCIAAGNIGDVSCLIGQVWSGQTGGCFPDEEHAVKPCCCGRDVNGLPTGRTVMDQFDTVQAVGFPGGGGTRFLITRTIDEAILDPVTQCYTYRIREHVLDYTNGDPPAESESFFIVGNDGVIPSCTGCGWDAVAYNNRPQGALVGGPGQTWGIDCDGFNVPGTPGHVPTLPWCTANWSLTVDCDRLLLSVTYTFFDPSSSQTITTTFVTSIHREYDTADGQCNAGCADNEVSAGGGGGGGGIEGYMDGVVATTAGAAGAKRAGRGGSGLSGFRALIRV